jgi:cysteinyl-tRNA synthetase
MKLYDTLTRQTKELQPLDGTTVKIYTCGLTVYSQPHIGNWLGYVYWDVLVRTLRATGYHVERTQNITDVGHLTSDDDSGEDKMEKGAKREGITAWDVAAKYIDIADHEGFELLGLVHPDHLVRATDYIEQQIAFAKILEDKGYTYVIPDDGLYFDTSKLNDYGKLAQLDIAGLQAGARVPVAGKKNITDFAIWKFSHEGSKRDMEWDSPWGVGFPGWHLECSVIAHETLGDQIDIHTGGIDHIPVHHTNEIAQTEAVTGKPFGQFWVHNNHLKADGQKMSKSIGNIYTLQDILDKGHPAEAFRVFVLGKHYRTEGNFTWDNLEAAANRLQGWREITVLRYQKSDVGEHPLTEQYFQRHVELIKNSLSNDLDTVSALNELNVVMNDFNISKRDELTVQGFGAFLHVVDDLLGLSLEAVKDTTPEQKQLVGEREQAREQNDWAKSDELRDKLAVQGVGVRDTPHGAIWYWI